MIDHLHSYQRIHTDRIADATAKLTCIDLLNGSDLTGPILTKPPHGMGMNDHKPPALEASLAAWEVRYRVPVVFAPTVSEAVSYVEGWALWFAREHIKTAEAIARTETPIP